MIGIVLHRIIKETRCFRKQNTLWKYSFPDNVQECILFVMNFKARKTVLNGSILYLAVSNPVAEVDCTSFQGGFQQFEADLMYFREDEYLLKGNSIWLNTGEMASVKLVNSSTRESKNSEFQKLAHHWMRI